jgi:hypothetical protein
VVPHNILLPVDFSAKEFRLEDCVNAFSHLPAKHFSTFFIGDYVRLKSDMAKVDRSDVQKRAESMSRKLKVDLKFIPCPGSLPSLWYQSRFADLMVLNLQVPDSSLMLSLLYAEKFFDDFACPVMLQGSLPKDQDEIIFLFDHDPSGLGALKSYLALFGEVSKDKKLTVVSLNSSEGPGIYFEKSLIQYLQQIFTNVGVLPMSKPDIEKNVISFASRASNPLIIIGKTAGHLFGQESNAQALTTHPMSLYYSNH